MNPAIAPRERQSEALRLRRKRVRADPSVGRAACSVCAMPPLVRISLLVASRLQQGLRCAALVGLDHHTVADVLAVLASRPVAGPDGSRRRRSGGLVWERTRRSWRAPTTFSHDERTEMTQYAVTDPRTGERISDVPTDTDEQVTTAVASAHRSFVDWARSSSIQERAKLVSR